MLQRYKLLYRSHTTYVLHAKDDIEKIQTQFHFSPSLPGVVDFVNDSNSLLHMRITQSLSIQDAVTSSDLLREKEGVPSMREDGTERQIVDIKKGTSEHQYTWSIDNKRGRKRK